MKRYIQFDHDGYQVGSSISLESPGDDWFFVGDEEEAKDKRYVLDGGKPREATQEEVDLWFYESRKVSVLRELRDKRDELLAKSDWTQIADVSLTEKQKEDWQTYRQMLRDLPEKIGEDLEYDLPTPPIA